MGDIPTAHLSKEEWSDLCNWQKDLERRSVLRHRPQINYSIRNPDGEWALYACGPSIADWNKVPTVEMPDALCGIIDELACDINLPEDEMPQLTFEFNRNECS